MPKYAPIKERFTTTLLNSIVAYLIFLFVSDSPWPTGGLESVWLFSAISFWFFASLSAPWFAPPRDTLSTATSTMLGLIAIDLTTIQGLGSQLEVIRWVGIALSLAIIVIASLAILFHDDADKSYFGSFLFRLTAVVGRGELLFSIPAMISIVAVYHSAPIAMSWLLLYWIAVVTGKPIERVASALRLLRADRLSESDREAIGHIVRVDHPNIVRVKLQSMAAWKPNRLFTAGMPDGSQQYVFSLFSQIQGTDVIGTGLCIASVQEKTTAATGKIYATHDQERTAEFINAIAGSKDAELVGFVVENSSISVISFEVSMQTDLREGDVVFANTKGAEVFYQIIGAETFEESFDQNPRGTHVVRAAQLGAYSSKDGFKKYAWLPMMNEPIFVAASRTFQAPELSKDEFVIGKLPSTSITAVARVNELIEYHTAILGVTGTGKTELALDIIREAAWRGTKIFCVDFTGDYRVRLADLGPIFPSPDRKKATAMEGLLAAIDSFGFKAEAEKSKLKTLLNEIRDETAKVIDDFLKNDETQLAIFELSEISNSKAGLRLTEIYLSAIMNWAREHRRARQILICLEEAHTIVPEVNSGFDGETRWVVERIGQIALQGRKYGVGLLVITQRTALVSKTILSQCNTFLTHSLIDQTSLSFLESVYSSQHVRLIPNLGKFEFLGFGKGLKAERPIILKRDFDAKKLDASMALTKPLAEPKSEQEIEGALQLSDAGPKITSL